MLRLRARHWSRGAVIRDQENSLSSTLFNKLYPWPEQLPGSELLLIMMMVKMIMKNTRDIDTDTGGNHILCIKIHQVSNK